MSVKLDRQQVYLPLMNRWWAAAVAANRLLPRATWDVTSDSLALWLAQELQADESVLLKSCYQPDRSLSGAKPIC